MECIFCKLVQKQIPSFIVSEDDKTLAFLDINPAQEGHTLIIPKRHAENLWELDVDSAKAIMPMALKVAEALQAVLNCDGLNLIQNNGKIAGQEVFHFHLHVVPRYKGRGINGTSKTALHPGSKYEYKPSMSELENLAKRLSLAIVQ